MSTIWKYKLEPGWQVIRMPAAAKPLTVQTLNGEPCLWAIVDPAQPLVDHAFEVVATGQKLNEQGRYDAPGRYVGTFQMPVASSAEVRQLAQLVSGSVAGTTLVFHVFDLGNFKGLRADP